MSLINALLAVVGILTILGAALFLVVMRFSGPREWPEEAKASKFAWCIYIGLICSALLVLIAGVLMIIASVALSC